MTTEAQKIQDIGSWSEVQSVWSARRMMLHLIGWLKSHGLRMRLVLNGSSLVMPWLLSLGTWTMF